MINYHPGKANVVADELSRKSSSSVSAMAVVQKEIVMDLEKLKLEIVLQGIVEELSAMSLKPLLRERISREQQTDPYLGRVRDDVRSGKQSNF